MGTAGMLFACPCKDTSTVNKDSQHSTTLHPSRRLNGNAQSEKSFSKSPTNSVSDHSEVQVPMIANAANINDDVTRTRKDHDQQQDISLSQHADLNQNGSKVSDTESNRKVDHLREEIRAKRVALRKLHAKLKLELNNLHNMKEFLNGPKHATSANLPQEITATERSYSEKDFLKDFRQLFENSSSDILESSIDLENFTKKHTDMLEQSSSCHSDKEPISQLVNESDRLISDSEKMLAMLQKAMRIASMEYRLKLVFSEDQDSAKSQVDKLESALLDLQRLKSSDGLHFNFEQSSQNLSTSYCSARDAFMQLFPAERIMKLEKKSKIKLAELHIDALWQRQKNEEITRPTQDSLKCGNNDKMQTITTIPRTAGSQTEDEKSQEVAIVHPKESNNFKKIVQHLSSGEKTKQEPISSECNSPNSSTVLVDTKVEAWASNEDRYKQMLGHLKKCVKSKNLKKAHELLIDLKSIKVDSSDKIIDDAFSLLLRSRHTGKELDKDVVETTRAGLRSSLGSENAKVIADFLVRAQLVGLKNGIEIMGAHAKLSQLQHNDACYKSELKKMEDYMDRLSIRASNNKSTVDLIMSLERAIAVADCLDISTSVRHKASGALHVLNTRKQKIKSVKDELQRAVMECRHDAITCAIAEAESLPYFLEFDPYDGQIAAILDYAKHKISSHAKQTDSTQQPPAERRVKSNLKRAMKGNSSSKLESAISLFRKTYNVPSEIDKQVGNVESQTLIRRAERKWKRMKKQEKIEEKAWIGIRNNLRESLKSAMIENDRAELWKAVYQFKRELGSSLEPDDDKLLCEAKKQLREVTVQQCKANLINAMKDRDYTRLRHSLVELDSPSLSGYAVDDDANLKEEIAKARKLVEHLSEMERLKKSVSDMSRSQLAEIHRYPNPPACVRSIMTATYILLGENEKELKDWTAVSRLLVKMGRESLLRRVTICSPNNISAASAHLAQDILSELTQSQVPDVHRTAAIFYGWAQRVIAEVLDRHQHDPSREEQFRKRPQIRPKPKEPPKDPVKSEFWNRLSRPRSSTTIRANRISKNPPRPISAAT